MSTELLEKEIEKETKDIVAKAMSLTVTDVESYKKAAETLLLCKDMKKKVSEYFKLLKENAYKTWEIICNKENAELQKIASAEKYLSDALIEFEQKEQKKRKELNEKIQKMFESAERRGILIDFELEDVMPPDPPKIIPKIEGLTTKTEWDFKIVDESLIPREYLMPDYAKIRGVVTSLKDKTNIPGIQVHKVQIKVATTTIEKKASSIRDCD